MQTSAAGDEVTAFSKDEFLAMFKGISDELTTGTMPAYEMPKDAVEWVQRALDYTVPGGKLNRGMTVVHTLQAIKGKEATAEEIRQAGLLGWMVEWLQAFFLIADDVMDSSVTRRGKPCWYRQEEVGMIAINDAFIVQSHIYILLKKHFRSHPQYALLLELFTETTWQTEMGQLIDLITCPPHSDKVDLSRFTAERHHLIVKYKTAFYSFYLPVALGLVVAGKGSDESLEAIRPILLDMGEYFQVQDDYLDCFGDPEVIGKVGTDIQDNKCSWLVVQAKELANEEQKELLQGSYGRNDPKCIEAVKALYADLGLVSVYEKYEAECHERITGAIKKAGEEGKVPPQVFELLLAKIFKRSK